MGRSVMTASNAVASVFFQSEWAEEYEWQDEIDNVRSVIQERFPTFENCDYWPDRGFYGGEVHAILENGHSYVTISDYCGTVAICLVPRINENNLAEPWCRRIANNWCELLNKAFNGMAKVGTMSNGVSVYRKVGE